MTDSATTAGMAAGYQESMNYPLCCYEAEMAMDAPYSTRE